MGVNAVYFLFIVGMGFMLSFVRNSTFIDRRSKRFYCATILVNMITYAAYMSRGICEQYQLVLLANMLEVVIYAGSPLIAVFLLLSHCKKNGKLYTFTCLSQAVYTVLCVSSIFSGLIFVVDEHAVYRRGSFSVVAFIFPVVMEIIWVACLLIEYRDASIDDKLKIASVAFIELVAIGIQLLDTTYKFSNLGSSFLLILYYVFLIEIEGKYDKMTKIYNQRYYAIVTSGLTNNYSIIVFDVNGLKGVNDNLGHEYGDKLIMAVAESINDATPENCSAFRIGGDEFVMLVRSTKQELIDTIISNIKANYAKKQAELGVEVSTSIGVAINTTQYDYTNIFRQADANMYDDKRAYYSRTGHDRRQARRQQEEQ